MTLIIKQAFFPKITSPRGCPVKIQDTEGNEWEFQFRYLFNGGSMIYVLEGLKDYMVSRQWQAGDIGKQSNSLVEEFKWPLSFNFLFI